ncbi:hypothetical protein NA56DRAFT_653998 [Hyaloscypha hepaticicola]|uniref:C2H2-type domain-containing protein n=1 Tax=Hyaloscypha hepaticicola TaxID=2082293 RepID=A0A2J6QLG9_9HELO|nr:hypothetical protein NA56DRAFT_653998 [Hyaloscypha hepaticicola]
MSQTPIKEEPKDSQEMKRKRQKVAIKYPCPDCGKTFAAGRWTEHMKRVHFPDHVWECSKINEKTGEICSRLSFRKDNFATHLQGEHDCVEPEISLLKSSCKFKVVDLFHQKCGICDEILASRDESFENIKDHFKDISESLKPPADLGASQWKERCDSRHNIQRGVHYAVGLIEDPVPWPPVTLHQDLFTTDPWTIENDVTPVLGPEEWVLDTAETSFADLLEFSAPTTAQTYSYSSYSNSQPSNGTNNTSSYISPDHAPIRNSIYSTYLESAPSIAYTPSQPPRSFTAYRSSSVALQEPPIASFGPRASQVHATQNQSQWRASPNPMGDSDLTTAQEWNREEVYDVGPFSGSEVETTCSNHPAPSQFWSPWEMERSSAPPTRTTYRCHVAGCGYEPSGEERWKASNLKRHQRTQHGRPPSIHKCYYPGCGSRFTRSDNLRSHQRDKAHFQDIRFMAQDENSCSSTNKGYLHVYTAVVCIEIFI